MRTRTFGRLGWPVSEIGFGMWGIASWSDAEEIESRASLDASVELGCNFFDTAWAYGRGYSERLLGEVVRRHSQSRLYTASKIPPKNLQWPSRRGMKLDEVFPPDHIREYTERTLENLGLSRVDLMQFHVWEDAWARDTRWQKAMYDLKREGLVGGVGISVNRWEPWNGMETLRTGLVDAVQVIYNVFDQAPEDELFPLCRELEVAVIARVPLDEGALTGNLTRDTTFPEGDFRRTYFGPQNLGPTMDRVEALQRDLPEGMSLPELALRFILSNPDVSTVIPGMRKGAHVRRNAAVSDAGPLEPSLLAVLRRHRWDRVPTEWSF
ncbi:MAG TPA: aldo/keto reductase [Gemmatimonadaceae bacterium]|nr:aldo/keto reductase [Gemmatimonadaceae bacterium]